MKGESDFEGDEVVLMVLIEEVVDLEEGLVMVMDLVVVIKLEVIMMVVVEELGGDGCGGC